MRRNLKACMETGILCSMMPGKPACVCQFCVGVYGYGKGRPARPEPEDVLPYGSEPALEMEYEDRKIRLPENLEEKPSFPVRKYHIDTNEHVNNCQYVQMALEVLPEETRVRQIRVEYKKSAVLGDVIFPKVAREENRIVTELCDENGKPYAVIEIK